MMLANLVRILMILGGIFCDFGQDFLDVVDFGSFFLILVISHGFFEMFMISARICYDSGTDFLRF